MSSASGVVLVDVCMGKEELEVVKGEILRTVADLHEGAMVGLVTLGRWCGCMI